ncbi:MAG TPA: beta-ketoacyl-ACP synthase [Alphaproteobacteria bacterium]|nr:beta-ketoacyl-ACP synthase [Alphaproteobacteria bacterium]
MTREVWVTGTGLLSPLGERPDEWWPKLGDPAALAAAIDTESYTPFSVYPIGEYDIDSQIPRPGDQRTMGPLMHYGCYAAGLALEAAGVKGNEELLLRTHMVVASGGGERDWELDHNILENLAKAEDRGVYLNEQLSNELRPTLFLAQLPNLFAGNISIVHGVAGSSRTFMGEEAAGVDSMRIAYEKILAGQGDLFLVGAAFNAARPDIIHMTHAGGYVLNQPVDNLWDRPRDGVAFGSAGAFLVLEAREHAEARGATPVAKLSGVLSGLSDRSEGAAARLAEGQWAVLSANLRGGALSKKHANGALAVISGACGSGPITHEEQVFLENIAAEGPELAVRGTGRAIGHSLESSFIANAVLAIDCLARRAVFPPLSPEAPIEARVGAAEVDQVLITGWGYLQGEGMALLEAIDG